MLYLGLLLAVEFGRCNLPEDVLAAVRSARAFAAAVKQGFAGEPPRAGFLWQLMERRRDRLRLAWSHLEPTPADLACFRIPAALFPAYYVARPARLLVKWSSRAVRRLVP
jgi:hypothetical protein